MNIFKTLSLFATIIVLTGSCKKQEEASQENPEVVNGSTCSLVRMSDSTGTRYFVFDDKQQIKMISHDQFQSAREEFTYSGNKIIRKSYRHSMDTDPSVSELTKDANGRIIKFKQPWVEREIATFSYNAEGYISKVELSDEQGNRDAHVYTFSYKNGNLDKVELSAGYGEDMIYQFTYTTEAAVNMGGYLTPLNILFDQTNTYNQDFDLDLFYSYFGKQSKNMVTAITATPGALSYEWPWSRTYVYTKEASGKVSSVKVKHSDDSRSTYETYKFNYTCK